jgi:hypothetical protein
VVFNPPKLSYTVRALKEIDEEYVTSLVNNPSETHGNPNETVDKTLSMDFLAMIKDDDGYARFMHD